MGGFTTNFSRVFTFCMNIIYTLLALAFLYLTIKGDGWQLYLMLFMQSLTVAKLSWDRWYDPRNVEKGARTAYRWHR